MNEGETVFVDNSSNNNNNNNNMVSFKKWFPFLGSRKEASSRERLKARSRFVGQNSSPASTSSEVESGTISRWVFLFLLLVVVNHVWSYI